MAAMSASGWRTPISLFAAITDTSTVRSEIERRSPSRSTNPSGDTPSTVSFHPSCSSRRQESSTDLCSVATVMMWSPRSRIARAAPLIARLFDSVAPLVKTISPAEALSSDAIFARAASTASCASHPKAC
jgi:hypothetical protein